MKLLWLVVLLVIGTIGCQSIQTKKDKIEDQSFYKMNIIRIALSQSEKMSTQWEPQQRDCAGFVRFVYKNAIGVDNPLWSNWDGNQKIPYANAELLVNRNFTKLSDEVSDSLKTGDILVFRREDQKKEDEWHLMLVMESPWEQGKWLVTYHNGSRDDSAGVKKLWMNDLIDTEQFKWKPIKENRNFVGVYRWNAWINQ